MSLEKHFHMLMSFVFLLYYVAYGFTMDIRIKYDKKLHVKDEMLL